MNDEFLAQLELIKEKRRGEEKEASEARRAVQIGIGIAETVAEEHQKTREAIGTDKKVEVKNLPSDYATSGDVQSLKEAIKSLQVTTEQKDIDFNPLVAGMDVLATKMEMGFEAIPQAPEPFRVVSVDNLVDNTEQLQAIKQAIQDKETTVNVEAPEVNVEAPKVDVKPPEVNVTVENEEIKTALGAMNGMFNEMLRTLRSIEEYVGVTARRPIPVGSGGALGTGTAASTPTDTDNLLMETGDNLLLETGDQILLE